MYVLLLRHWVVVSVVLGRVLVVWWVLVGRVYSLVCLVICLVVCRLVLVRFLAVVLVVVIDLVVQFVLNEVVVPGWVES